MKFTLTITLIILLFSCMENGKHENHDGHMHEDKHSLHSDHEPHDEEKHDDHKGHDHEKVNKHSEQKFQKESEHLEGTHEEHLEGIHLSKQQFDAMDIRLGDISKMKINDYIKASGTLGLPPNAFSTVSAKAEGTIKNTKTYLEGSFIKKGSIVAYIENTSFIKLQQEYLETLAEINYLSQEVNRQQTLVNNNAGVGKTLQKIQSEYNIKNATLKGLEKQLQYLGIDAFMLSTENITSRIPIVSPISGYVTFINMHNGKYIYPETELMQIVQDNHLHLELDVFEKDIAVIKRDQKISYTIPALGNKIFEGEIHEIGKEFNTKNKTIRIHGHLLNDKPKFIKDLFVDAKIWLNNETVSALPENSIITEGELSYIFITKEKQDKKEVEFEKILVNVGASNKGYISIKLTEDIPKDYKIVIEGSYFIYAQSKSGEMKHEH